MTNLLGTLLEVYQMFKDELAIACRICYGVAYGVSLGLWGFPPAQKGGLGGEISLGQW